MPEATDPLTDLFTYPLFQAVFGRRSRRFGLGMELPSGPLAFESDAEPHPLTDLERSVLLAAGTGVSGWHYGIPFGPNHPGQHADFAVRLTGRTAPTAAGIGTPVLFHTDDAGTYLTNTREVEPSRLREATRLEDDAERIIAVCRAHTEKLSESRVDIPSKPGHVLEPNHWWTNTPGSTLFMPVGDASEEMLALLCLFVENGYLIVDDEVGEPAGDLDSYIDSGLLNPEKAFPLSLLERATYEQNCAEVAFMAHNIVLTMQAMGLGGLYFAGINELSLFGAPTADDVEGLGFRFVENEDWTLPNPVGLDGRYEGLCPPYYSDMRAAVDELMERKFGPGGAYDPATPGPWKDSETVKESVAPYDDELVECLSEIAQYVYDKHGRFPGTVPTMVLPGCVQAHHIDTDYYDAHFKADAYLDTHAEHMRRWHGENDPS
ncbi:hypothetical protein [Halalkalicoccus salilacus]|uniref:hypothetical protein n=1 Tax=Halalkalicoccus salilacus TaxID=3117459 RepID=UPI00300EED0D